MSGLTIFMIFAFIEARAGNLPSPELPPVVHAQDLLPEKLLKGEGYSIGADVPTEGYLGHFTLNTQSGVLQVHGTDLLKVRIREVSAMAKLDEVSKTDVFAKAAVQAAASPLRSLKNVAENPVETVKGIPSGATRFFKKTAKMVQKTGDAVTNSGDDDKSGSQDSGTSNAVKEIAGVNAARRKWAKDLQIDPYTTNPILKKKLEDIAWASFAGGLTMKVAMPPIPGTLATTVMVSNMVWSMPPEDLQAMNEKKLAALGVGKESIDAFFKNGWFTPTTATALTVALEGFKGVGGISEIMGMAATVDSEDEALFLLQSLRILGAYHRKNAITKLGGSELVIVAKQANGKSIIPAALDYVSWTDEVIEFTRRSELKAAHRLVLLSGKLSGTARRGFTESGWELSEGASAEP